MVSLGSCPQTDVVDDIPTAKFVYIMYMGENVKPLVKGKIPTLKGVLDELFSVSQRCFCFGCAYFIKFNDFSISLSLSFSCNSLSTSLSMALIPVT